MIVRALLALILLFSSAVFLAQDWQPCPDWEAFTDIQDTRITLAWQPATASDSAHFLVDVDDAVPAEAALTLAFPPIWKAFTAVWNGDTLQVAAATHAQQLELTGRWNTGTNTLEVLLGDAVALGLNPQIAVRGLQLTRTEFREDGLYLIITNAGTSKVKGASAAFGCKAAGRAIRIEEVINLKPGKSTEVYIPATRDQISEEQHALLVLKSQEGQVVHHRVYLTCDLKLEVREGVLQREGDTMRIHSMELSAWPGGENRNTLEVWEAAIEKWKVIGGNAVNCPGKASEQVLRMAAKHGLMVFEQHNDVPIPVYTQEYRNLAGSYDWNTGKVVLYGSNDSITTMQEEKGTGAWMHGGIHPVIPSGWGGWLGQWQEREKDPHYSGQFFNWDCLHAGELWNSEGTFLPAVNELKAAFNPYQMLWVHEDFGTGEGCGIRQKWGPVETDPVVMNVRRTDSKGTRIVESIGMNEYLGGRWYNLWKNETMAKTMDSIRSEESENGWWSFHLVKMPGPRSPLVKELCRFPAGITHSGLTFDPQVPTEPSELSWELDGDNYVLEADSVTYAISMQSALPVAVTTASGNLLPLPCEWTFDRLPIRGEDRMMPPEGEHYWRYAGNRLSVLFAEVDGATLTLGGEFMDEGGEFDVTYAVDVDGVLTLSGAMEMDQSRSSPVRVGVQMYGDSGFHNFSWTGYGPLENYADRSAGAFWGKYKADPERLLLPPYDHAQEAGSVARASELSWTHGSGWTLEWSNNSGRDHLGFSALPYLPQLQKHGTPWVTKRAMPVVTLNVYNAPIGRQANRRSTYTWSWTLNVSPSDR